MYIANYLIFFLDDKNIFLKILGEQEKKSNYDAEVGINFPSFDLYFLFDTTLHCAFKRPYPIHTHGWTDYMLEVFFFGHDLVPSYLIYTTIMFSTKGDCSSSTLCFIGYNSNNVRKS